ncbi:MAG: head-tail connector protein [Sarcina sp.]
MDLDLIKSYLRVDFNDDNDLIQLLYDAAQIKIEDATGKIFDKTNKLHQIVALKIIAVNYEVRDGIVDKKSLLVPRFIESDLFKIKYSGVLNGQKNNI